MSESNPDEFKDDGPSFSDEELEAALAGFEAEFRDEVSGTDPAAQEATLDRVLLPDGVTVPDDASELTGSFDDELEGLLGNKAKTAMIITQLASADLLAAFCQLADVSATCLEDAQGAVAVLRNLDGDGPEAAAKDLTCVVSGMPVILAVNRADKLEATLYVKGHPGQTFAPADPVHPDPAVRGGPDVGHRYGGTAVIAQGVHTVDSGSLDREAAMKVIAQHTRFGRGSSKIQ